MNPNPYKKHRGFGRTVLRKRQDVAFSHTTSSLEHRSGWRCISQATNICSQEGYVMKTGIGAWFQKPDGFEAVEIKTINTVLFVFAAAGVVTGGIVLFAKMQLLNAG